MKPGELIETCIKGFKAYNPNKMTVDAHLEVFLAEIGCTDEGDSVFIKQANPSQSPQQILRPCACPAHGTLAAGSVRLPPLQEAEQGHTHCPLLQARLPGARRSRSHHQSRRPAKPGARRRAAGGAGAGQVSREDYHLYMVFSYLTLLRLEDLGIAVFREFVRSQVRPAAGAARRLLVLVSKHSRHAYACGPCRCRC